MPRICGVNNQIIRVILRHTFTPLNNTRLTHLCGPADSHLRTIEAALSVKIAHRHEQFKVDGPKAKATLGMELLQALYEIADRPYESYKSGIADSFTENGQFDVYYPLKNK